MLKTLVVGLALTMAATAATAQQAPCQTRSKLIENLAEKYKESSVAVGIANGGKLVEVLTTDGGGTWSIIMTSPAGISCLVAAGEGWRKLAPVPVGPEA